MTKTQIELLSEFSWEYRNDPMDIFLVMENKLDKEFDQWLLDNNKEWDAAE